MPRLSLQTWDLSGIVSRRVVLYSKMFFLRRGSYQQCGKRKHDGWEFGILRACGPNQMTSMRGSTTRGESCGFRSFFVLFFFFLFLFKKSKVRWGLSLVTFVLSVRFFLENGRIKNRSQQYPLFSESIWEKISTFSDTSKAGNKGWDKTWRGASQF